jgi:hypothetical protein
MPTPDEVVLASHDGVQAELRVYRPNASPWSDVKLGPDDGAGHNFSNRTLRPFIKDCYAQIKTDPVMAPVKDSFDLPARLPVTALLDGDVTGLERYIASDVCGQLGI